MSKESNRKILSVIIPAYKQEKTIKKDLTRIIHVLKQIRYDFEIIVVVDGFLDKTYEYARKISSKKVSVLGYRQNLGKGHAVRFGMSKAKGSIIAFLDSGMDINPNGLSMLLEHFEWYSADIIVGSKLHPVSKINYPLQRIILSWGYRLLVKMLFGLSIRDTQAGIKLFRRKVLTHILPRLLVKKYAFDIEILAVAHSFGYKRIYEAPIELNFKNSVSITSTGFWKVIFYMLLDTLAVFFRLKIFRYYQNNNKKIKYNPDVNIGVNLR